MGGMIFSDRAFAMMIVIMAISIFSSMRNTQKKKTGNTLSKPCSKETSAAAVTNKTLNEEHAPETDTTTSMPRQAEIANRRRTPSPRGKYDEAYERYSPDENDHIPYGQRVVTGIILLLIAGLLVYLVWLTILK